MGGVMIFYMATTPTTTRKEAAMSTFTHASYNEAQAQLKRNKRNNDQSLVTWDAGDGWTAQAHWCDRRKRIVSQTVSPAGFVIH